MNRRFFVNSPISGDRARLVGSEARHLAMVLRARVGESVLLFDGSGAEFDARVVRIGRTEVDLAVVAHHEVDRELPRSLTLAVALPKGDRQRWLVEKSVELGVTRLVPLETARGVAQPGDRALDRLQRAVIEASKQCGRNRLMEISPPQRLNDFLRGVPDETLRLIAHPDGAARPPGYWLGKAAWRPVCIAVGPEGGFNDQEIAGAGDCPLVSLGPRLLRIETAALALAAAVCLAWNPR